MQTISDRLRPGQATLLLPFREPAAANAPPLRVAVVLESSHPPRWVHALLDYLRQIPGIHLETVALDPPPVSHSRPPGWLVERLHRASLRRFDPFTTAPLEARPATLSEIAALACDLLIWLAPGPDPSIDLPRSSRHGALTLRLGLPGPLPFLPEVAASHLTTTAAIVWHDRSFDSGRILRAAETATVPAIDFTLNAEEPLIAVIRMLGSLCLELQREGTFSPAAPPANHPGPPPALHLARFLTAKLARGTALRLSRARRSPQWFIALRPNTGRSLADPGPLSGFTPIPLPPGSPQIADPFLCESAGQTWLLFEDIPAPGPRGRLACMPLLPDGSCGPPSVLLERPYHLSYPCVFESRGELFLIPESSAARQVQLYRIAGLPSRLDPVALLADDFPAVDTTPILLDGVWYFFTTTPSPFMETLLFCSSRLDGPWRLHPASPISCSVRSSRSAGHLFWKDGRLFRPTQDCSVRYGYAITLNEVDRLTPTEFAEHPVHHILPTWMPGLLGTHTWNQSPHWQVIDGLH